MATNDKTRKGKSRKAGYAKRKALGNERTNKAKRAIKQARLNLNDKAALARLQSMVSNGDVPTTLLGKAKDLISKRLEVV